MIHQKKKRGHWISKIVKSRQSGSNGYLLHCSFYYLACTLMHDVACEFVCAVRMQLLVAWLSLSIPVNVKLTSDYFLKWNQYCVCRHTLLNQHWTVLKVKLTSLSSRVAVKSTFDHFWSEINIFDLTGCRQINIWLFLKWSWTSLSLYVDMKSVFHCHTLKSVFHCHTLTWNQYLIYCFCC